MTYSELNQSESFRIADKYEIGLKYHLVKPFTIEKVTPLKIYNHIYGGYIDFAFPEQYLMKYTDATVFPHSDFILTQNLAVWDKFHNPVFTKNMAQDKDLISRVAKTLNIKNRGKKIIEFKRAFSLCGVYADVWSHFMIQYLPKLYYTNKINELFNSELTILIPNQTDEHLKEVFNNFIQEKKQVQVYTLKDDEIAHCTELFYMESATLMIDHESYVSYSDMIIPKQVATSIKENLVNPFIKKYDSDSKMINPKIFIRRKNAAYRNMKNCDEVEEFFVQNGFLLIEPHLLSFQEKILLFQNAEIVAGPNSAGFSNLIFSKPDTKVLLFSNLQRSFEPYLSFFDQHFELNFLTVTGIDEQPENSHSSFYIPLDKIKDAYYQLLKN